MSFEPINTQEEFEKRLTERLEQKGRSVARQFENYTSPEDLEKIKDDYQKQIDGLNQKYSDFDKKEKEYQSKIAKYESDSVKTRIAREMGIPDELVDRLKGSNEDELREDAKLLSAFSKQVAPLASTEQNPDGQDEVYKKMLKDLNV